MAAKLEKTKTPGIFKRGSRYVFSYRVNGKQKWESAADTRRGEAREVCASYRHRPRRVRGTLRVVGGRIGPPKSRDGRRDVPLEYGKVQTAATPSGDIGEGVATADGPQTRAGIDSTASHATA